MRTNSYPHFKKPIDRRRVSTKAKMRINGIKKILNDVFFGFKYNFLLPLRGILSELDRDDVL